MKTLTRFLSLPRSPSRRGSADDGCHRRYDGHSALVAFVGTVAAAPYVDMGIVVGAGVGLVLYLLRP